MRTAEEVEGLTAAAIQRADRRIEEGLAASAAGDAAFEGLFGALDDAGRIVAAAYGDGAFLRLVAPDLAVREAAERANEQIEKWRASLPLREDVATAVNRYVEGTDLATLDDDAAAFVRRWATDVRLAGSALPPEAREEVRRLTERLIELQTLFQTNLIAVHHLELTAEELEGVPEPALATLKPGTAPGSFDVPIDDALGAAILDRGRRRDVRERAYEQWLNRGMPGNRAILEEAVETRRKLANLLGYRSWHELRTENLAADSVESIERFIADMAERLEPLARVELETMRRALAAEIGAPDDLVLGDWDWRYVEGELRGALGAHPEQLEPYLELDTVFAGLAALSEEVFGVRLEARPERPGWHPDVRSFDLVDVASGEILARMQFDPYVRAGKAGNAFADLLDPGDRAGRLGEPRPPTISLVTNSPAPSDGPSLLSLLAVEMIFHEYGHVLDFGLPSDRFALHRADAWVAFDWVEGPSNFLGRWGTHPDVMARYARHHETGEALPRELVEPLVRVEALNSAFRSMRHLSMARLDVLLHGASPVSIEEADREAWKLRLTPYIEGTNFPATFGHLLGGYDGAVYGFVWSSVLRDDLLSRFEREGMTSPALGAEYRRAILEWPWTRDPLAGHAAFLGRPWSIDAFIARIERATRA